MISVYLVEDEENIREATLAMLEDLPVKVQGAAANISDAYLGIKASNPELVILDIELGNHTSFDLLEQFQKIDFKVLFVTAHSEYAIKAFQFSAVNYLLKPLSFKSLAETISQISGIINSESNNLYVEALKFNLNESREKKVVLKTSDKIHVVHIDDIIKCESDTSYTIFFLASKEQIIVSKTLLYYHELLSSYGFYRVHKSHLINVTHVVKIHKAEGGDVEMSDSSLVPISQRKREEFLKVISEIGLS